MRAGQRVGRGTVAVSPLPLLDATQVVLAGGDQGASPLPDGVCIVQPLCGALGGLGQVAHGGGDVDVVDSIDRRVAGTGTYPYPMGMGRSTMMSDANIRLPEEAKERLAAIAAAEGLSLRAYLARLAETLLTPAERAERAEKARMVLEKWNGYAPTSAEQQDLDTELDRRLAEVTGR